MGWGWGGRRRSRRVDSRQEVGRDGGRCAPAPARRAPTPPTAPTLLLARAEPLGGGGRGPRGAGRADLLTSVCLGRGSAARQAPGARLEPDVPRRRSGRHRRGALARTGWRAHGRAGRAAAGAPGRAPPTPTPGCRGRPQTRGGGKVTPRPRLPASADSAPPGWASDPGTLGSPGWGPSSPAALSRGGKDPSTPPARTRDSSRRAPQVCFLKFVCKVFLKF